MQSKHPAHVWVSVWQCACVCVCLCMTVFLLLFLFVSRFLFVFSVLLPIVQLTKLRSFSLSVCVCLSVSVCVFVYALSACMYVCMALQSTLSVSEKSFKSGRKIWNETRLRPQTASGSRTTKTYFFVYPPGGRSSEKLHRQLFQQNTKSKKQTRTQLAN